MSNAIIGALRVVLGLDSAAFEKGMGEAQKTLNRTAKQMQTVGGQMQKAGGVLSLALTAPIAAFAVSASAAATESGQALGQVEARIKSMGNAAGFSSKQYQDMAESIQDHSLFDDDDVLRKVTSTLQTFGNVAGNVFKRGQQAAVDMAAALGQDLQGSAVQVGKALNDPIQGLTALSRVGVSFTEEQKAQIKSMVEHGQTAQAQGVILDELAKEFGGAAQSMRDDDPFAALNQSMRGFSEAVGPVVNEAIKPLTEAVTKAVSWFQQLPHGVQQSIVMLGLLAAGIGPVVGLIGSLTAAVGMATGVMAAMAPTVASVRAAWLAYAASVALVGPVQATVSAGALALGAAINFALGPIGLCIAAVGLLTTAWYLNEKQLRESKIASEEYTKKSNDLKAATDAYATAALAAAGATGEEKKSALEAARVAKVLAQQKMEDARASLVAAQASLTLAEARQHEWASNQRLASGNPMTGGGVGGIVALINIEELRINKARANIEAAKSAIDAATSSITRSDAVISAGATKPPPFETTKDSAKTAKAATEDLFATVKAGQMDWDLSKGEITPFKKLEKIDTGQLDTFVGKATVIIDPLKKAFLNLGETIAQSLGQAIIYGDDLGQSMARLFQGMAADWAANKIAEIFNKMRGIDGDKSSSGGGGFLDGVGKALDSMFSSPGNNAAGTSNWRGGLTWVGEDGPELLNVPSGAQVYNQSQLSGMMGGGLQVHVEASPYFDARVERVAGPLARQAKATAVSTTRRSQASDMDSYNRLGTAKR